VSYEATEPGQFFVLLYFVLFAFFELYLVCCSVLFVSIRQVIGCEDCLPNDLDCRVRGR